MCNIYRLHYIIHYIYIINNNSCPCVEWHARYYKKSHILGHYINYMDLTANNNGNGIYFLLSTQLPNVEDGIMDILYTITANTFCEITKLCDKKQTLHRSTLAPCQIQFRI